MIYICSRSPVSYFYAFCKNAAKLEELDLASPILYPVNYIENENIFL
jgi:hypothetical protein